MRKRRREPYLTLWAPLVLSHIEKMRARNNECDRETGRLGLRLMCLAGRERERKKDRERERERGISWGETSGLGLHSRYLIGNGRERRV